MRLRTLCTMLASLFFWVLVGCTAWEYDIDECDPDAPQLGADRCNQLNTDPNDCHPYSCDRVTRRCVQMVRDADHDGDPDSRCGGTDCRDSDPTTKGGPDGMCSCKQSGTPCEAGIGACLRTAAFECRNDVLVCPAMAASPRQEYQSEPYVGANSLRTADWNCDGVQDFACCYLNENQTRICSPCNQAAATLCPANLSGACKAYCESFDDKTCPAGAPKMYACTPNTCGAPATQCTCQLVAGGLLQPKKCVVKDAIADQVHCR